MIRCCWPRCMKAALGDDAPLCLDHAVRIWTHVERRGLQTVHGPMTGPTQYAEGIGHPVVYYVLVSPEIVKIGCTANVAHRVSQLRLDMSALLAAEPGGYPKERHRHREFAHIRIGRRENFQLTDDLREHIDLIRQTFGEPAAVHRAQHAANVALLAETELQTLTSG